MIAFTSKGDFSKTTKFLTKAKGLRLNGLDSYGAKGVVALSSATPIESGATANAWSYKITNTKGKSVITWTNSNVVSGVPIAIILQYGHGTRNGGFVQGRDYINPAMTPLFDSMADLAWKEVTKI